MEKQFDEMLHEFINLNIQGVDLENEKELTSLYNSKTEFITSLNEILDRFIIGFLNLINSKDVHFEQQSLF